MTVFRPHLLAAILCLATLAGAQEVVAPPGSGRPLDPYLVSSLGHLLWISQNPRSWSGLFEQVADIDARPTANWDRGRGFAPIGTQGIPFQGTFRGHGHAIQGLTISRPDSANRGLFGWVGTDARLDSIYLLQASVFGLSTSGILAGTLGGGTAFGCRVTGRVLTIDGKAGGLVGYNHRGHLQRCQADAAVYGEGAAIGGLAGSSSGEIDDSHASGNVEGFGGCGGLVGDNEGLILSSSATGSVFGRGRIGGLAGGNQGSIRYSQATGSAKIHSPPGMTPGSGAGGLVGSNEAEILHCHASGAVEAGYSGGGLVGWNSGRIERSYATGNVVVEENSAGGLVGSTYGGLIFIPPVDPSWAGFGEIRQCYATGTVQAKLWAGGLSGFHSRSTVEQSYASGAVIGGSEVGGLFGKLELDSNASKPMVAGSYWDIELTGQRIGFGSGRVLDFGAEGRTTAQMRARSTFVGWDFDTIWSIDEGFSSPLLHVRSKPQRIAFPSLGLGLLSDSFVVARAWASSGLPITLSSSDPSIAIIEGSRIRLVAPGLATITARQGGDSTYLPAVPVSQVLRVASFSFAGRGTPEVPFRIATLDDLRQLSLDSSLWNSHFVQVADIDASLTASWDSGRGFKPIGGAGKWFNGSYNGRGHAITGLSIHRDTSRQLGFFGVINSAALLDSIRLVDVSVRGKAVCGSLVGRVSGGRIRAAHVSGSVACPITAGGLGGVSDDDGSVVASSASVTVRGERALGGLLGQSFGPVRRSWATGSVTGSQMLGGLIGLNGDTIENCYARGSVSGDSSLGGLVGSSSSYARIVSSYAAGKVEGDSMVGGLIGKDEGSPALSSYWDAEATGRTEGRGSVWSDTASFHALGRTTAEMKARATYAGWDFATIWSIDEGADYPVLRGGVSEIATSDRGAARGIPGLSHGAYPLEIFDLRGRRVWAGEARWNGARWELPRLGAGAWVLRARTADGLRMQKVTVVR